MFLTNDDDEDNHTYHTQDNHHLWSEDFQRSSLETYYNVSFYPGYKNSLKHSHKAVLGHIEFHIPQIKLILILTYPSVF